MLLISWGVGILYHENVHAVYGFPMLIAVGLGGLLRLIGLRSDNQVNRRDGYVIVLLTWLSFSLIGMLPFLFGHYVNCGVVDACFEAISGFTTTGATILTNIDTLPRSILFWRSLTHWIGGLGIVILSSLLTLAPAKLMCNRNTLYRRCVPRHPVRRCGRDACRRYRRSHLPHRNRRICKPYCTEHK